MYVHKQGLQSDAVGVDGRRGGDLDHFDGPPERSWWLKPGGWAPRGRRAMLWNSVRGVVGQLCGFFCEWRGSNVTCYIHMLYMHIFDIQNHYAFSLSYLSLHGEMVYLPFCKLVIVFFFQGIIRWGTIFLPSQIATLFLYRIQVSNCLLNFRKVRKIGNIRKTSTFRLLQTKQFNSFLRWLPWTDTHRYFRSACGRRSTSSLTTSPRRPSGTPLSSVQASF